MPAPNIILFSLVTVLFASIVLITFASCGNKNSGKAIDLPAPQVKIDENKPGWEQDTREITFSWYVNFPWYTGKWGQDLVTQYVTELTGVSAEFIVPAGNANEKLNTLIASDTLPDIITIGWYEDIAKQIQTPKFLYNLEELAEAYDPYFLKVTNEASRNWYRQEDGGVYGYPNVSFVPSDFDDPANNISNDAFMVRKDIYTAIGSPNMSTPEGFLDALKAANAKYPKVDGQSLITIGFAPFGGSTSTLGDYLQNFLAIPGAKDGAIYDRYTDPEYIKWLKVFREANELGLISRDVFSDTRQQIEEKITQGRYFAIFYPYIDAIWPLTTRVQNDPDSAYISIAGPKNSNGDEHQLIGGGISGWTLTMISKNNKDPEKAIRFLEFLFSPKGKEVAFLGKKGVTWDVIDGKPSFLPEVAALRENDRAAFDKKYGADWLLWMGLDNAYQRKHWPTPTPEGYKQQSDWTKGKAMPRFEFENIDPIGNSELGIALGKYTQKFNETLPKLMLAKSDAEFDAIMQDFIDFRAKNDFDAVQAYRTSKFLENKSKLGL